VLSTYDVSCSAYLPEMTVTVTTRRMFTANYTPSIYAMFAYRVISIVLLSHGNLIKLAQGGIVNCEGIYYFLRPQTYMRDY
jgi:hypothetical protein